MKGYWDKIRTEMELLEQTTGQATVEDYMRAMRKEGNEAFFLASKTLDPDKIEKPFPWPEMDSSHEGAHIITKLGHTPQQEQWVVAAGIATQYGHQVINALRGDERWGGTPERHQENIDDAIATLDGRCEDYQKLDKKWYLNPEEAKIEFPTDRQKAVYFALALYADIKLHSFCEQVRYKSYDEQRVFALSYIHNDEIPSRFSYTPIYNVIRAPYQLLDLSDAEVQSTIAVALGLKQPQETPYPNRLTLVKDALVKMGLYNDMKPWAENLAKNRKDFNKEAFDTARIKRQRRKSEEEPRTK